MLLELDAYFLPRHQLAESLTGCVAEWLALLGRVDPCDADSVLHLVGIEDGDRVAVGNLDDGAFKDAGCGGEDKMKRKRNRRTKRRDRRDRGPSIGNAPKVDRDI